MVADVKKISKVTVGSTNPVKVMAVKEVLADYPLLAHAAIVSVNAPSTVSAQPLSLEEVMRGAMNRAKNCFGDGDLSFGIESGLLKVPYTTNGFMNICACVIYDGTIFHTGLSPAFECPPEMINLMVHHGYDMNQAYNMTGITHNPHLGAEEGGVNILTDGRMNRHTFTKQAIVMALISLEKSELFK